jgi:hypothetical protein
MTMLVNGGVMSYWIQLVDAPAKSALLATARTSPFSKGWPN